MTPDAFINLMLEPAKAAYKDKGIPVGFTIAQGALESDWFNSQQAQEDFNLFGIKADANWKGLTQIWATNEFIKGRETKVTATFRRYSTLQEGLEDHSDFFVVNPRYHIALQYKNDCKNFAIEVAKAGYATDPDYAKKLLTIINVHKLDQYDNG